MQPSAETRIRRVRSRSRWILYALLAMFTTGFTTASAALASGATARPAHASYRVIPLSPELDITSVSINASGQVAFTELVDGNFHARFFDGHDVHSIGTLGGPTATTSAVNDQGQVAGTSAVDAGAIHFHAYRWSRQTGMEDLGKGLPGESTGEDINNKGQVTGGAEFASFQRHAFLWSPNTGMRDIGALDFSAFGTALSDAGTVTGLTGGNSLRVFRWTRQDGMRAVTSIYNDFTAANDINAAGHIVGAAALSEDPSKPAHAFLWTPREGLIDLGASFSARTVAEHINDKDMVTGNIRDFTNSSHSFVWTRATGAIEIGAGSPKVATFTAGLNKHGQVVGGFGDHAFVWTLEQGVVDLNTRLRDAPDGLVLLAGRAISDNGAIVAQANTGLVLLVPTAASRNEAPVVGPFAVMGTPGVHALLTFSAAFRDADTRDTHTAVWDWGDGAANTATVSEKNGAGSASGQHAYRAPGSYKVKLSVTDSSGRSTSMHRQVLVPGAAPR